jgi:hypothetical protein
MPVRFTSPSLGGQRNGVLQAKEWQVGVAYRRLVADEWYLGKKVDESKAPFGRPLFLDINSIDLSVSYAVSDRLSLTLTLPFSSGTHSRFYADTVRHKVAARGLGDVNLVANLWVLDPNKHPNGEVALGLGIKTPSGNNHSKDDFFLPNAPPTIRPVDQAIQLGDGGWGIMLQAQGYRRLSDRASAYAVGSYLVSPRVQSDVPSPIPGTPTVYLAVPDVYSARAGLGFALSSAHGVSASLGGRIDGIPQGDLVGGIDSAFRRPGYSVYLDPGLTFRHSGDEVTLGVPLRVLQDFQRSAIDRQRGFVGGGDLAEYLVFVGYSRRF